MGFLWTFLETVHTKLTGFFYMLSIFNVFYGASDVCVTGSVRACGAGACDPSFKPQMVFDSRDLLMLS